MEYSAAAKGGEPLQSPGPPTKEHPYMNRLIAFLVAAFAGSAVAAPTQYLVVSKGNDTAAAVAAVRAAGGTVRFDLSKIGVVSALSDSASFAASVAANPAV